LPLDFFLALHRLCYAKHNKYQLLIYCQTFEPLLDHNYILSAPGQLRSAIYVGLELGRRCHVGVKNATYLKRTAFSPCLNRAEVAFATVVVAQWQRRPKAVPTSGILIFIRIYFLIIFAGPLLSVD
jgi:hypothetical protein